MLIAFSTASGHIHAEKRLIDRLPQHSEVYPDFSHSRLIQTLNQLPLHHIEGIWKFPATGAEVAIIRQDLSADGSQSSSAATAYQMILLDSPSRTLRPGTIMGLITPSSTRGEYNARIYTENVGSTLLMPKSFTLTLSDQDASLKFVRHRGAFTVNLWRLLPYLWRYTIHPHYTTDIKADGCVRIYPNPPIPREPVYL